MYVYEATVEKCDDGDGRGSYYFLRVPAFDDCFASGETLREAVESCAVELKLAIAYRLDKGKVLPKQELSDPPGVALCVEVTDEFIASSKCLTVNEAAEELGVTHGRVCQLLDEGQLEAYMHGGKRMVTIASINERKKNKRGAGRPRKKG